MNYEAKIVNASSGAMFRYFVVVAVISLAIEQLVDDGLLPAAAMYFDFAFTLAAYVGWMMLLGKALERRLHGNLNRATYKNAVIVGTQFLIVATLLRLLPGNLSDGFVLQTGLMVYSFASIFWVASFVAKLLKENETTVEDGGGNHLAETLLIVAFPFGIWFIQPRVNRIFSEGEPKHR